jgi:3-deoxy-D-manno-octulosonate 8-phosphate phosphatase (KDO 8-P phosphatase)
MRGLVRGQRKEILSRMRRLRIRLAVTDCDGVLTDTGVYYSDWGEAMKRFSVRDGMAVHLLQQAGIEVAVLSDEESPSLVRRADKLHIERFYTSVQDKRGLLLRLMAEMKLHPSKVAYIGDDVNDLDVIQFIKDEGVTGAPQDAHDEIRSAVHYVCARPGGHGAFREFADWILEAREPLHPGTPPAVDQKSPPEQVLGG